MTELVEKEPCPPTEGFKLKTPWGSLSIGGKKGAEIITTISLAVTLMLGWITWQSVIALQAVGASINNLSASQRELICTISQPQEKRERDYLNPLSICKVLAR